MICGRGGLSDQEHAKGISKVEEEWATLCLCGDLLQMLKIPKWFEIHADIHLGCRWIDIAPNFYTLGVFRAWYFTSVDPLTDPERWFREVRRIIRRYDKSTFRLWSDWLAGRVCETDLAKVEFRDGRVARPDFCSFLPIYY
jgi:hypothetical protein